MKSIFIWTFGDVLGLAFGVVVVVVVLFISLVSLVKHARCKHDGGVNENMECNAFCRKCGKNLGFIGTRHEKQFTKGETE